MGWKAMGDLTGSMAFLFPKGHRGNLMAFLFQKPPLEGEVGI
jgi:hypothetical protein